MLLLPKLGILDRHFIYEVLFSAVAIISVLLLITVSDSLVKALTHIISGKWPANILFPTIVLSTANIFPKVLPLALLLAVIIVVGRMQYENEITVMEGCGKSYFTLFQPLSIIALVFFTIQATMVFIVLPKTEYMKEQLTNEAETKITMSKIVPGRFLESEDGQQVIYAQDMDEETSILFNLFVYTARSDNRPSITTSSQATYQKSELTGNDALLMADGYRYDGTPGVTDFTITDFEQLWLPLDKETNLDTSVDYEAMSTVSLFQSDSRKALGELHWRIALAISLPLLMIAALPLGKTQGRGAGRYSRVIHGILIYIIYYKLLLIGQSLLVKEKIPDFMGLWWIQIGAFSYIAWTVYKAGKMARPSLLRQLLHKTHSST